MIDVEYKRLKPAQKPASALIPFADVRAGDLIDLGELHGMFHVGQKFKDSMYQGRRPLCGIDEVTDIPADAKFVVFRKHFPKRP